MSQRKLRTQQLVHIYHMAFHALDDAEHRDVPGNAEVTVVMERANYDRLMQAIDLYEQTFANEAHGAPYFRDTIHEATLTPPKDNDNA